MSHLKVTRAGEEATAGRAEGRPASGSRWAVILAGGDGTRLRTLTRAISGDERPKQFCAVTGGETLLDQTRRRVALAVHPDAHLFVVTKAHERYYRQPLADVPRSRVVAQPANKGTAPAILYALLRIARTDPDASVAFFPSDHYFADEQGFAESVEAAFRAAESRERALILLGVEPESAETSYGWIEPDESLLSGLPGAVCRVRRFWEKPDASVARELLARGCLWNSFVMVGRASAFIRIIRRSLRALFRGFASESDALGTPAEDAAMRAVYDRIPATNFSHEVLTGCAEDLFVLRVGGAGWSDLGEPSRVLSTLARLGVEAEWAAAAV